MLGFALRLFLYSVVQIVAAQTASTNIKFDQVGYRGPARPRSHSSQRRVHRRMTNWRTTVTGTGSEPNKRPCATDLTEVAAIAVRVYSNGENIRTGIRITGGAVRTRTKRFFLAGCLQ